MKARIDVAHRLFVAGCKRAANLTAIHAYLNKHAPAAMDCDDILRSALVLSVGSFDLFIHDIFRLEVLHRLRTNGAITTIRVPFDILHLQGNIRAVAVDECIRKDNSYKSFVAPEKLADCLRPLLSNPWEMIALKFGDDASTCKTTLKGVVDLRNRIAHEADVNPDYGGVELWPIYGEDVERSISFLRALGQAIADALDTC